MSIIASKQKTRRKAGFLFGSPKETPLELAHAGARVCTSNHRMEPRHPTYLDGGATTADGCGNVLTICRSNVETPSRTLPKTCLPCREVITSPTQHQKCQQDRLLLPTEPSSRSAKSQHKTPPSSLPASPRTKGSSRV